MEIYFFYFFAALTVASALGVVWFRNPISSAISLVVSFFGIAALYVLLQAHFLAIIQILVYAGAIMVLFIFVIMLLNLKGAELEEHGFSNSKKAVSALVISGILFVFYRIFSISGFTTSPVSDDFGTVKTVGKLLFTDYIFPFEYASILLLAALVGGVILAKREL